MASKDLGNKHTCWKCSTRFYDLRKPAPVCPKCGADAREAPAPKAAEKKARAAPRPEPVEEVDAGDEAALGKEVEEGLDEELEEADDE